MDIVELNTVEIAFVSGGKKGKKHKKPEPAAFIIPDRDKKLGKGIVALTVLVGMIGFGSCSLWKAYNTYIKGKSFGEVLQICTSGSLSALGYMTFHSLTVAFIGYLLSL
jgi:hypothetical protein